MKQRVNLIFTGVASSLEMVCDGSAQRHDNISLSGFAR